MDYSRNGQSLLFHEAGEPLRHINMLKNFLLTSLLSKTFAKRIPHKKKLLNQLGAVVFMPYLILLGNYSSAQQIIEEEFVEKNPATQETRPWEWLRGPRDQVSRNVTALGRNLDNWLAGEGIGEQENETYLRIRFNQELGSFGGYNSRIKIGGSLDLPRASERWKLIFESDTEDLKSLEDSVLEEESSEVSTGAFSYQQYHSESWQLNHDIGLRARIPGDPFYRFKAKYNTQLSNSWALNYRQKIWHYKSQGWGYDTNVSFNRQLDSNRVLAISSEVKYQQNEQETEFSQSIALHHSPAELNTHSYEIGILGSNKPNVKIDNYFVGARYRRALEEDKLFIEILPQILVSQDENWRPEPRLLINLEVLFFDY